MSRLGGKMVAGKRDSDIQQYVDGELGPRQARRVRAEIAADPQLKRRCDAVEQMGTLLRGWAEETADEADLSQLWQNVRRRLPDQERVSVWQRWQRKAHWGLLAAAAAAAVGLAVFWLPSGSGSVSSNTCVIESLDVGPGAVSTIFTIADPEAVGETTVIWISEESS